MINSRRHKYFLQEHLHRHTVHGGIGNIDAEKILLSKGFHPLCFPCLESFSLAAKWKRLWFLLRTWLILPAGSILVFQFPVYPRMHQWLIRLLSYRKRVTIVCFIADIDGLKDGNDRLLRREKQQLRRHSYFIVHNQAMEDWLKSFVPASEVAQITFFDFLTSPVQAARHPGDAVIFAGNLAKSRFLLQLGALEHRPLKFVLYGAGMEQVAHWPANVIYKGIYAPYQLPQHLEGSYGLVWDGDGIDDCTGSLGQYMAWISHHKLSLYLVAGLPVITAKKAASAVLVEQYGVGFAVNSLQEIATVINTVDEATYQRMVQNTRAWAARITQGKCLGDALDSIEKRIMATVAV